MSGKTICGILSVVRDNSGNFHDANTMQKYGDRFDQCGITYASLMDLMREHGDKRRVRNKLEEVKDVPPGLYAHIANVVSYDFQQELNES